MKSCKEALEVVSITTITHKSVNCYLLKNGKKFLLIDTGFSDKRHEIERDSKEGGCNSENLQLIVLTHGDTDHCGNCKYLRDKFEVKVAMHEGDSVIAEKGDMKYNRKDDPDKYSPFFRIMSFFGKEGDFERFKPDLYKEGGDSLNQYDFNASILHLPGYSAGSIGILTQDGDFFCGDLFVNITKPHLHYLIDDLAKAKENVKELKEKNIQMVYPGHGKPFPFSKLSEKL
ncbi:MAG: MBL fold metallo-hydrolase [Candidatus Lokiarchaeota archaeon]|nr:MBL fold metallo-hydrolase [Candidatus Lokiarchaeota archaeon]